MQEAAAGAAMAMRIVAESATLLGAPRLIPIASAHIDGAFYHGDSGTLFAESLVEGGARVAVRSTLNVGALDLVGCSRVGLEEPARSMARRMMEAYRKLGCDQSWTCAPYQAGHRPGFASDVAIGSSSASAVLLELVHNGHAPAALILHEPDAILLLGVIVARGMGWQTPVALKMDRADFETLDGTNVNVSGSGNVAAI